MTVVVHLTEASSNDVWTHDEHVQLLRCPFADAIADDGLASVLAVIDGLDATSDLVVVHPNIHLVSVDRLAALIRRSQRRRETIMIAHGLGPLGADLLVESLTVLLSDPTVGLEDAAAWCRRSEAIITDVVWTTNANPRWAHLDLRDRLRARLPGRRVRAQLGPQRHAVIATKSGMITGLQTDDADVVVSGRDASVIARTVQQLGTSHARSVRVVESVVAEVVISSSIEADSIRPVSIRAVSIRPVSSAPAPWPRATTTLPGSDSMHPEPRTHG